MRKLIKGCLGVATAVIAVHFALAEVNAGLFDRGCDPCAAATCDPCDAAACDPCDAVCNNGLFQRNSRRASQWNVGGHIEAGLWGNQWGQTNRYGFLNPGSVETGNSDLLYNVRNTGVQMNQAWLFVERQLDTKRGIDFGGRIDFAYGTDATFLQSDGLEFRSNSASAAARTPWGEGDYYAAIAQAYAEVGFNNVNVKVGKFLSPFGHESVMSPDRFFYSLSHAYGYQPATHTGVVATWSPNKKVAFAGGWCSADNTFYNGDDNTAVFGAIFTPNKKVSLAYWGAIGQDKSRFNLSRGEFNDNYFLQSVVLTLKPNSRWEYTFEWSLCNADDGWPKAERDYFGYYGINNELIYRINKKWAVGLRAEWMHTYDTFPWGDHTSTNLYEYTVGVNWTPNQWLLIRPEVRYDKVYGDGFTPFNSQRPDPRDDQISGGFSAVVKF